MSAPVNNASSRSSTSSTSSSSSSEEDARPTKKHKRAQSFGLDAEGGKKKPTASSSGESRKTNVKPKTDSKEGQAAGLDDTGSFDGHNGGRTDFSNGDRKRKGKAPEDHFDAMEEEDVDPNIAESTDYGTNIFGERDYKGQAKARKESPFPFPFDDDDEHRPVHADHIQLKRLLKNMTKPKVAQSWWLEKVPVQYSKLERLTVLLPEWLQMTRQISVQSFYGYFRPRFLLPLSRLLDLGGTLPQPSTALGPDEDEEEFDSVFRVGPGGLDFFMTIFDFIYDGIDQTYHLVEGNELCLAVIAEVQSSSCSLLSSLQHLRSKHPRASWDPKGCSELSEVLCNGDSKLPLGLPNNRMLAAVELISLHPGSATFFTSDLTYAFGHARDSKLMLKDVLIGGPYGLPYFYESIVSRILDELEHAEYDCILSDASACCTALAQKATSYIKSGGDTSRMRSTTPVPRAGGSTAKPDGMRTRSAGADEKTGGKQTKTPIGTDEPDGNEGDDESTINITFSDEAPETRSSRTRAKRRKNATKGEPILVESSSEEDSVPPPKRKAHQRKPTSKPQPSASKPSPAQTEPPSSGPKAGPSSGASPSQLIEERSVIRLGPSHCGDPVLLLPVKRPCKTYLRYLLQALLPALKYWDLRSEWGGFGNGLIRHSPWFRPIVVLRPAWTV
ncbi:hypothetical protein DFH06DRAFT_355018 [Mycena polygramma]|nr:hypothetical protein DFH06DRAFT_355018 [Mycena polygramma]